jgi:hypothetical protein
VPLIGAVLRVCADPYVCVIRHIFLPEKTQKVLYLIKTVIKKQPDKLVFGFKLHKHALKTIVLIAFLLFLRAMLYQTQPTAIEIQIKKDGSAVLKKS